VLEELQDAVQVIMLEQMVQIQYFQLLHLLAVVGEQVQIHQVLVMD
jgi:hypothetical protein